MRRDSHHSADLLAGNRRRLHLTAPGDAVFAVRARPMTSSRETTLPACGRALPLITRCITLHTACGPATQVKAEATRDTATRGAEPVSSAEDNGPQRPEPGMQPVLDQQAALGPKPMDTLTPAAARTQPAPGDAVKALLVKQGKNTTPSALVPGVTSVDRNDPQSRGADSGAHLHAGGRRSIPGPRLLPRRRMGDRGPERLRRWRARSFEGGARRCGVCGLPPIA